jgi:hypothetical protein
MSSSKTEENAPLNNRPREKSGSPAAGRRSEPAELRAADESYDVTAPQSGLTGDALTANAFSQGQSTGQLDLLASPDIQTRQRQNLAARIGQVQGNHYLQRLVASVNEPAAVRSPPDSGRVQRQGAAESERPPSAALDLLFPDFYLELRPEVLRSAQRHIEANESQEALNVLAAELDDLGLIDLSILEGEQLIYDPAQTAGTTGGKTRTTWMEVGQGRWERQKIEIFFGPRVMLDANMLYSAIMHEWQHVRQVHDRSEPGGQVEELLGELDAYCWQVEHAEATGTYNRYHMSYIRDALQFVVWARLTRPAIWETFSDETQAQLTARYENAMQKIEAAPARGS